MRNLIEFLRSTYVFLLFVILEIWAVNHYAHSTVYTRARMLSQASRVAEGINGALLETKRYFSLGRENDMLLQRITELENQLSDYRQLVDDYSLTVDTAGMNGSWSKYVYTHARVVGSTANRQQNLIVIDKGLADGVKGDMAVISPAGAMVGYVVSTTEHLSVVMPVINTEFRSSGQLLHTTSPGSIRWDGTNIRRARLCELPKYANPQVGDTVVSSGHSSYFPEGIIIGRVESLQMDETNQQYNLDIQLAADIPALHRVIVIENRDGELIEWLKNNELP